MTTQFTMRFLTILIWAPLGMALVPANPMITAPPLVPRQNDVRFMGFLETAPGSWYSAECRSDASFFQSGEYARCCATSRSTCDIPTRCFSGSLVYETGTRACTDVYDTTSATICETASIFENFGDPADSVQTLLVCGDTGENRSYYRRLPASATAVPSTTSGISSTSSTPESSVSSSTPASSPSSTSDSSSTPSASTTPAPAASGSSKAWIAGAVVGPIAGIAIVAAIAFFLLRRNRKHTAYGGPTGPIGVTYAHESKPVMSEVGSFSPPGAMSPQTVPYPAPYDTSPGYYAPGEERRISYAQENQNRASVMSSPGELRGDTVPMSPVPMSPVNYTVPMSPVNGVEYEAGYPGHNRT